MGNPWDLELLDKIRGRGALETKLHRKFAALHLRNEWFKEGEEIFSFLEYLEKLRREYVEDRHALIPYTTEQEILEALEEIVLPEDAIVALPFDTASPEELMHDEALLSREDSGPWCAH
jgi:hypothetical protein